MEAKANKASDMLVTGLLVASVVSLFLFVCVLVSNVMGEEIRIKAVPVSSLDDMDVKEAKKKVAPVPGNGEKASKWTSENLVRPEGKQLTGWSKVKLDSDLNRMRFKIGIITGEIYAPFKAEHDANSDAIVIGHDWDTQVPRSPVYGFVFTREF